jgi:DNA-binding protein HU-beta
MSKKHISKKEIVAYVARKFGLSKATTEKFINVLTDEVERKAAKKGGKIQLGGFGSVRISTNKRKIGRNPITGEVIKIPVKSAAKFRASKALEAHSKRLKGV